MGRSQITARLETLPFCFRNSINAFRLEGFQDWQKKTVFVLVVIGVKVINLFTTENTEGHRGVTRIV